MRIATWISTITDTRVENVLKQKQRPDLITVHCNSKVNEVVTWMKESDVSQLPVVDDDKHLLGLVSEVSLLKFLLNTPGNEATNAIIRDLDVVDRTVATVTPDTPLEAVMSMFTTSPVVVVVESTDREDQRIPVGILTKIDLLSYLTAQV